MCMVCGCSVGEVKIEGGEYEYIYVYEDGMVYSYLYDYGYEYVYVDFYEYLYSYVVGSVYSYFYEYDGDYVYEYSYDYDVYYYEYVVGGDFDFGVGLVCVYVLGMSQLWMVQIEQDILSKNNSYVEVNCWCFDECGIFILNLVFSFGFGKMMLFVKIIELFKSKVVIIVVEGDQQILNDVECICVIGVVVLQINMGKGCYFDGYMVGYVLECLQLVDELLFLIENVGNFVCLVVFDFGEYYKVVIFLVIEGEDKLFKYLDMFCVVDVMLFNKCDLLFYFEFDVDFVEVNVCCVNLNLIIFCVLVISGEGFVVWVLWIEVGLEV